MEAPALDLVLDREPAEPDLQQLPVRHDTVLPCRERRDRLVPGHFHTAYIPNESAHVRSVSAADARQGDERNDLGTSQLRD